MVWAGHRRDPKAIEWYYANGIPSAGIKAATVPSAVSTLLAALEQKGTMSFEAGNWTYSFAAGCRRKRLVSKPGSNPPKACSD